MKENAVFWLNPNDWPRTVDYIFLAAAVNRIGSTCVPGWKRTDPIADKNANQHALLKRRQATVLASKSLDQFGAQLTPQETDLARAKERDVEERTAHYRFVRVQEAIAGLATVG